MSLLAWQACVKAETGTTIICRALHEKKNRESVSAARRSSRLVDPPTHRLIVDLNVLGTWAAASSDAMHSMEEVDARYL